MVVASDQGTPLTPSPEALAHNYIHFETLLAVEVDSVYNEPTLKLLKFSYFFNKPPPVIS